MTFKRVGVVFLLFGAALGACDQGDEGGEPVAPRLVAGLRYVNAVSDTGAVDFRIIDIVGDAPNAVGAAFRTGGSPYGIATTFLPPHLAVQEGTRRIRVFMSSTDPAIATQVLLDTSYTFQAGSNYTFILYGYARTGSTPAVRALITNDDAPVPGAGMVGFRTVHVAPTLAPSGADPVDVFIGTQGTTPAGSATFSNRQFLGVSSYTDLAIGSLRAAVTTAGTTTVLFQANAPAGVVGTTTTNPIAGTLVAGTSITALIVPRSVSGSAAPASFTTPSVLFLIDRKPPLTAP